MMNYGRLFLLSITVLVLFQALFGCAKELVRTDLQTLQQYPDQFRGKQVIVTALTCGKAKSPLVLTPMAPSSAPE